MLLGYEPEPEDRCLSPSFGYASRADRGGTVKRRDKNVYRDADFRLKTGRHMQCMRFPVCVCKSYHFARSQLNFAVSASVQCSANCSLFANTSNIT